MSSKQLVLFYEERNDEPEQAFADDYLGIHTALDDLLYKPDHEALDVVMAAVLANEMPGDAVALLVISPSSTSKTELLMACRRVSWTHWLSTLTENALASGMKTEAGDTNTPALLNRLEEWGESCLLLKDFTSTMSMKPEQRRVVIAQYREILDGQYRKEFGTGETVEWEGKLGMVAAVTPIIDREWASVRDMGDRFVFLRVAVDETPEGRIAQALGAIEGNDQAGEQREILSETVAAYLEDVRKRDASIGPIDQASIAGVAEFLATVRTPVHRDGDRQVVMSPAPEGPPRLAKTLVKFARAIAVVRGHSKVEHDDLLTVYRIVRDTAPRDRITVLTIMGEQDWDLKSLLAATKLSQSLLRRVLEDLEMLGLVESESEENGRGRPPKSYRRTRFSAAI